VFCSVYANCIFGYRVEQNPINDQLVGRSEMVRFRLSLTIISLTAVAFITSGCNQPRFSGLNDTQLIFSTSNRSSETAREESYAIAKRFLEDCPTFAFDGIEDTLDIAQVMQREYPPGWLFRFEFNSQHTGYGDRRYESLIPEITRHEAVITVEEERVTKAVMDRSWDMILHLSLIHISEPTRLGMISYAVFCLKKKKRCHID